MQVKILLIAAKIILLIIFFSYYFKYLFKNEIIKNIQINIFNHIQYLDKSKQNIFSYRVLQSNSKNYENMSPNSSYDNEKSITIIMKY